MSDFKAMHVVRSARFELNGAADQVFPLLCPVREGDWVPGWQSTVIHSRSGYAEKGCVFTSRHAGEPDTIWLITEHDPELGLVRFTRTTPGLKLADLVIRVYKESGGTCELEVSYTWTALSEAGNRALAGLSREKYQAEMDFWQAAINHYLKTGQLLA